MPSLNVGTHTNGWAVHVPPLSVPTLKSFTIVRDPPGGVTLNWKVRGPLAVSVPVAVHVIEVPSGCGEACDGVMDTVTVANAGAHSSAVHPARHNNPFFVFMGLPSSPDDPVSTGRAGASRWNGTTCGK